MNTLIAFCIQYRDCGFVYCKLPVPYIGRLIPDHETTTGTLVPVGHILYF